MLTDNKKQLLTELVSSATSEELIWMNGFLAGFAMQGQAGISQIEQPPVRQTMLEQITILYGTETGNTKRLANSFAASAKRKKLKVKMSGMDQYRLSDFEKEENVVIVISTHGEGEPPHAAKKFFDSIHTDRSPLNKLNYAVLALGDKAYPLFCKAGEDVDKQLSARGAQRLLPLQKCDTDFEQLANEWFEQLLQTASNQAPVRYTVSDGNIVPSKKIYSGTVVNNINLNDEGSLKETHHIEIISEEEIQYEPGDSIAIIPVNRRDEIDRILELTGSDSQKTIDHSKHKGPVDELLSKWLAILNLPERIVKQYALIIKQDIPQSRFDLYELLKKYPISSPQQFEEVIKILDPISPRLYSISSSRISQENEVHIIVSLHCFNKEKTRLLGLASSYLCRLSEGETFNFYVHKNNSFKLPADDVDIIMIGPGTGVAPFRAFLAERDARGASGRNWLFFGEQHFTTDFLYQTELQQWLNTGLLTKLSLAFSRDQEERIYVQHKLKENATELMEWIGNGAMIFICGSREPMSVDVEKALLEIVAEEWNMNEEKAVGYMDILKQDGRALLDVY